MLGLLAVSWCGLRQSSEVQRMLQASSWLPGMYGYNALPHINAKDYMHNDIHILIRLY